MIVRYANDGQAVNKEQLILDGFTINSTRDFLKNNFVDDAYGDTDADCNDVFNFVGFLVNDSNDVFAVFPKNYMVQEVKEDSGKLFNVIAKHMQKRPDMYVGNEYGKKLTTNYPFAAFFCIYEYFSKYGLYFDNIRYIKPNIGGKVNWKSTIQRSDKYLINGKLCFFPLYYNKKYCFTSFLTECMIFAIDYTLEKFGVFIGLGTTGMQFPEYDFLNGKEMIIDNLYRLRNQTFKDSMLELIDSLILFYEGLNEGGSYYFKHYGFSYIWEDMVLDYLKKYYHEVQNDKLIFDEIKHEQIPFSKKTFSPNLSNERQYFAPDFYYSDGNTQLIFDAKYYTKIHGMDYKQISYYFFLNECRDHIDANPKFSNTYSALILPAQERSSKIHFKMDPLFNQSNANLVISEEYLDIRSIIELYLKN
jgi:LlaJI restriction endonuclease.